MFEKILKWKKISGFYHFTMWATWRAWNSLVWPF
jgi:hypothetical protein